MRDAAALRPVLVDVRQHTGPIRGIVHAAGVLADRLIEDKTDEQFADVWSTKVDGAKALLEATAGDDLAVLAFFSSSTGRFGRKGQIDYAAANEALNKLAQHEAAKRPKCRVVSINWGPWDGGMVTLALKKLFAAEGVGVIGLAAGAKFLADELSTLPGGPVEIVVLGALPGDKKSDTAAERMPPASTAAEAPAQEVKPAAAMYPAFERELNIEACPVLRSHVINGRAVLPMALMVEWLATCGFARQSWARTCRAGRSARVQGSDPRTGHPGDDSCAGVRAGSAMRDWKLCRSSCTVATRCMPEPAWCWVGNLEKERLHLQWRAARSSTRMYTTACGCFMDRSCTGSLGSTFVDQKGSSRKR